MDDDFTAVRECPGPVHAQDHGKLLGPDSDASQGPYVVHVKACGLDIDEDVTKRRLGRWPVAQTKRSRRLIGIGLGDVNGKLSRPGIDGGSHPTEG